MTGVRNTTRQPIIIFTFCQVCLECFLNMFKDFVNFVTRTFKVDFRIIMTLKKKLSPKLSLKTANNSGLSSRQIFNPPTKKFNRNLLLDFVRMKARKVQLDFRMNMSRSMRVDFKGLIARRYLLDSKLTMS